MTRHTVVVLPLACLVAACARGRVLDDGPIASATTRGIPAAASSAYVPTPEVSSSAASAAATGAPPPPPSPSGAASRTPHVHDDGATILPTSLPAEVVRRIVRQNFGRFRLCYENGLRTDPTLAGSVRIRFVIEPDGAVGTVSDAGSILGDESVVACVERAFGSLAFPQPSAGAVTVTYALSFTAS